MRFQTPFYRYEKDNVTRTPASLYADKLLATNLLPRKPTGGIRTEMVTAEANHTWTQMAFDEWRKRGSVMLVLSNIWLPVNILRAMVVTAGPTFVQIGNEPDPPFEKYATRCAEIARMLATYDELIYLVMPPVRTAHVHGGTWEDSRTLQRRLWGEYIAAFGPTAHLYDFCAGNIYNWWSSTAGDPGPVGLQFGRDCLKAASQLLGLPPIVTECGHLTRGMAYAINVMGSIPAYGWGVGTEDEFDELPGVVEKK